MRIVEIASAEEQMALWRLVNDNVWQAIETQRQQQAQAAQAKAAQAKSKPRKGRKGGRGKLSIPMPPLPPSPKRSGSAKLNMLDKCIIGAFSHGIGAVTGGHHEQIIWAANPPRIQFGVQGQGGFGRVA